MVASVAPTVVGADVVPGTGVALDVVVVSEDDVVVVAPVVVSSKSIHLN